MQSFEDKYGIKENQAVKDYHKNRRMFVIKDGELFVTDEGVDYSHAVWFDKIGLSSHTTTDELINTLTRGTVEKDGLYFYKGYDFTYDETSFRELLEHLHALATKLNISPELHVYGGRIIKDPGKKALPRKDFGRLKDLVKTLKV